MDNRIWFLVLIIGAFFLSGCASSVTPHKEMYSAPDLSTEEGKPKVLTNVKFKLPPRLDVADSAFFYDRGIKTPSYSWKAILWQKRDGEWQTGELIAVRMRQPNSSPQLLITIPRSLKDVEDGYLAVADHAGNRLYNQKGRFLMKDWRDISPEEHSEFLTRIKNSHPLEVKKGEEDYGNIVDFYKKFRALEALQVRNYIYKQEGIPVGTSLSRDQVERLTAEYESHTAKLKELFLDDWYLIFTYPLLSPVEYGSYIMVTKLFQVPSVWWKKDLDSPGYMDRDLSAAGAYDMMNYYARNYLQRERDSVRRSNSLTPKEKKILKEVTGKEFQTYGEYLRWARKQQE